MMDDIRVVTDVSYGILNLSHRYDDLDISPMVPGKPETVRLKLRSCGQRFEPGQRIRLAIATSDWPTVFPGPENATLSLHCEGSRLILPLRKPQALDETLASFGAPESAQPMAKEVLEPGEPSRADLVIDQITGETTSRVTSDMGTVLHPHTGMIVSAKSADTFTVHPDDPTTAAMRGECWSRRHGRLRARRVLCAPSTSGSPRVAGSTSRPSPLRASLQ
ncbi:CocE/NonD family hydrolase C-terminal non-catalytic domain-containing protein [Mesorhizobium sp.]|uniref:CocE/NonD family hydrolase C-terminal non-catalytic domain-containing protein n=1 Tax=Mesorhizobium sp. TaxID=1871066 RepID=UPI0025BCFA73|nr:CocE/NonD family hydrolase C-terminal non-catalytic domain-containing protein [Mesorhizobium sp.]